MQLHVNTRALKQTCENVESIVVDVHALVRCARERALYFVQAILMTVDKKIEFSWNKQLRKYYTNRIRILESELQKTFGIDATGKES